MVQTSAAALGHLVGADPPLRQGRVVGRLRAENVGRPLQRLRHLLHPRGARIDGWRTHPLTADDHKAGIWRPWRVAAAWRYAAHTATRRPPPRTRALRAALK